MSSGYPFLIKSSFSCIFFLIKKKLNYVVIYLLFYSWFYMNFPLFHWNIARIPLATTFLFLWCATVMPQHFLFEWVKSLAGRSPRFHFQSNPRGCATSLLFSDRFSIFAGRCPVTMVAPHWAAKGIHVLSTYKRQEHASKMRETCERHARNMRVFPATDYTAPAPFFSDGIQGLDAPRMY